MRGGGVRGLSSSLSSVVVDKPITGYNQVPAPLSSTPPWAALGYGYNLIDMES